MKVGIAGYGIVPFSSKDQKIETILADPTRRLFVNNSGIDRKEIDAVLVSTNSNSKYLSPILSEMTGIRPKTAHTVESLCNSGTNAIASACAYIASGMAEMVLVAGAEKYDSPGQVLEWDKSRGEYKHPIFWGSIFTKSYKRTHKVSDEDLAAVPAKNHKHARQNPNALHKKAYTVRDVTESRRLTGDLRLLDCSRPCTGGASILLASEARTKQLKSDPVWITGIGQRTVSAGFTSNFPDGMESTRLAGIDASRMSGKAVKDVNVAEIHDAFSVCEPMALEALGFSDIGGGAEMVKELHETDNYKINPRGGLIGSGHPLGATGIAQTIEITQQLESNAGNRQTDCPSAGLVHNMSAAATSSTVLVLER